MTILSSLVGIASPLGRIRLIAEGVLLAATLTLGMLLHHAYEAEGAIQAQYRQEQAAVVAYEKNTEQLKASCAATDAIVTKTDNVEETISHETDKNIQAVKNIWKERNVKDTLQPVQEQQGNVTPQNEIPVLDTSNARDAALLGVLNTSYCEAIHYGDVSACNTSK